MVSILLEKEDIVDLTGVLGAPVANMTFIGTYPLIKCERGIVVYDRCPHCHTPEIPNYRICRACGCDVTKGVATLTQLNTSLARTIRGWTVHPPKVRYRRG